MTSVWLAIHYSANGQEPSVPLCRIHDRRLLAKAKKQALTEQQEMVERAWPDPVLQTLQQAELDGLRKVLDLAVPDGIDQDTAR